MKRGDSEITKQQYDGLETILRQWDCLYANAFEWAEEKGQLQILHQESLLRDCNSTATQTNLVLANEKGLFELLREVGGCESNKTQ